MTDESSRNQPKEIKQTNISVSTMFRSAYRMREENAPTVMNKNESQSLDEGVIICVFVAAVDPAVRLPHASVGTAAASSPWASSEANARE